jgi:cytochrome oxidase Cu insertion factor (SCO1/SenC/PrrC family)
LKRNPQLREKRTFKFDQKRDEYCTLEKFTDMYRNMYFHMVRTKIATKLDAERSFDVAGNVCDDDDDQGRKSKYKMDHPEKVVFVDETGVNTNQGKYGNIGGI